MNEQNRNSDGVPEMEDYGNADGDTGRGATNLDQVDRSSVGQGQGQGQHGHRGQDSEGSDTDGGGQFGEFGNTGTGVDLTVEMESNEVDPSSGLVKGGQSGEAGIAGLGQYGGEAGKLPSQ